MGILSLLLWTPAVGVLLLALIPSRNTFLIRLTAHIIAALSLLLGAPRRRMATRTGQAYQNQKAPTACQKHFQARVGYYEALFQWAYGFREAVDALFPFLGVNSQAIRC